MKTNRKVSGTTARFNEILAIDNALAEVRAELVRATELHGPMKSSHEGAAVIREEYDEFWDEVKANNAKRARVEVIQLAAMAVRYVVDRGGKD